MATIPTDQIPETEDKERVNRLARDIIAPSLHRAIAHAQDQAPINEVLSATANAYAAVLVQMVGVGAAAKLMAAHAEHLRARADAKDA